ncbi:MAG: response regulator, partial [Candidatus Tectomicrobia bacterium]
MSIRRNPAEDNPTVFVVDDDESVLRALKRLFRSVELEVDAFSSAQDFLDAQLPDRPACLVVDVRMPGSSGLDLQDALADRGVAIPIIFITGHGNVPMSVRAMKAGAVDFLEKPFEDQQLLDVVQHALRQDREARRKRRRRQQVLEHHQTLTAREKEVMALVVTGLLNKQIAWELGI